MNLTKILTKIKWNLYEICNVISYFIFVCVFMYFWFAFFMPKFLIYDISSHEFFICILLFVLFNLILPATIVVFKWTIYTSLRKIIFGNNRKNVYEFEKRQENK